MSEDLKDLSEALQHSVVSIFYMCYNKGDLEARKEAAAYAIRSLDVLSNGLSVNDASQLAEFINLELTNLYRKWWSIIGERETPGRNDGQSETDSENPI